MNEIRWGCRRWMGLVTVVGFGILAGPARADTTVAVSLPADENDLDASCFYTAVSDDGTVVAFATQATNVVIPDENGAASDVFLRDLEAGVTELISQSTEGAQGNGGSDRPVVSGDGSRVVFDSVATNLVTGDANTSSDVFLRDRGAGSTTLVSVNASGEQGDGNSTAPDISADGRYVAFLSSATNLDIDSTDSNGLVDAFVRDTQTGTTRIVSVGPAGAPATHEVKNVAISGNGRYVVFATATKWDPRDSGTGPVTDPSYRDDIYVRDLQASTTALVSVRFGDDGVPNGSSRQPAIDFTGDVIAFDSSGNNLVELPVSTVRRVYAYLKATDEIVLVSQSSGGVPSDVTAELPAVSSDGRYVCFSSGSSILVGDDTNGVSDAFLHDFQTGLTTRQSRTADGGQGNGASASIYHAISGDGTVIAFRSQAGNLVEAAGPSSVYRIFARQRVLDTTSPVITCSEDITGVECDGEDGATVEFTVTAVDDNDPNPVVDCSPASGSRFPLGDTIVSCVATDESGNEASCTFTVTVVDTTAPTIDCPAAVSASCALDATGQTVDFTVTATDACDAAVVITATPESGSVFLTGVTTVNVTAEDASGNSSSCSFDVTVAEDMTGPVIDCPDTIVAECPTGAGQIVEFTVTATDSCDASPTVTTDPESGTEFPLGPTTVTVTAEDAAGNVSTCEFTVDVSEDSTDPTIECPDPISITCASVGGATVDFTVTATDSCDPSPTVITDPVSGSVFPVGTTTVTATATDASGNEATCTFDVTVATDTTGPILTCPDEVVEACTSLAGTTVSFEVTAVDDCDGAPTVTAVPASGGSFSVGVTPVLVTATDATGNESTCAFTVTVVDTTGPVITCPEAAVTAPCEGTAGTVVEFVVSAEDGCGSDVTLTVVPESGSLFPAGVTAVLVTAVDASDNESTCTFDVIVVDSTAPQLTCPESVNVPCDGPDGAIVELQVTAMDDCDAEPSVVVDPASGSQFPVGATTVTATATDGSGNETTCTFTVTVGVGDPEFLRGNANWDSRVDISDAVFLLRYLFQGALEPYCLDAADINDDSQINITDPIFLLQFLFQRGPAIPPPGYRIPGSDPTPDSLNCGEPLC